MVAKLMVEEAEPITNGMVARKFGFLPSGRQDDGADVRGDMSLQLLRRLSALRANPTDTPIANFRTSVVVANYCDCADCSHKLSNVLQAKIRGTTIAISIAAELASSGEDFHLGYSHIADDVNQQPNSRQLERVSTRRTMVSIVPSRTPPTTPETLPESPEERAVQMALMTGRLEIQAELKTLRVKRGTLNEWRSQRKRIRHHCATTEEGKEITAPLSSAPEAKFKVLSNESFNVLRRARQRYAASPLELGVIYARVGLLPEAEQEFNSANCQSPVASKLLKQLRQSR